MFLRKDKKNSAPELIKALWRPFIVIFAVLYLAFNWGSISWVFNYKVAGQYLSDVAPQKKVPATQISIEPQTDETIEPENPKTLEIVTPKAEETPKKTGTPATVKKQFSISIPKIGITAPIVVSDTTDNATIHKYLDSGVVMYPDSAMPGQKGETILLGHSAPANWPHIKYDWVFSRVNELKPGDTVTLNYSGQSFNYSVGQTVIIMPGEDLPPSDSQKNLYLISCWPPGKDYKRIVIEASLVE